MSKLDVDSNRSYDSSWRQEQARQTRQLVTEAARHLFIEKGYNGATISAIARSAGVSAETIYATFGNKRGVLAHLVNVSITGDDEPTPLLERPMIQATEQEIDQRQQIRLFAAQITAIMVRMAPIFGILRTAAKTEADIDAMYKQLLHERRNGMRYFVNTIHAHGPLRHAMTVEVATDSVFALSSGEMFTVFTVDLGWTPEDFVTWLAETLMAVLLP